MTCNWWIVYPGMDLRAKAALRVAWGKFEGKVIFEAQTGAKMAISSKWHRLPLTGGKPLFAHGAGVRGGEGDVLSWFFSLSQQERWHGPRIACPPSQLPPDLHRVVRMTKDTVNMTEGDSIVLTVRNFDGLMATDVKARSYVQQSDVAKDCPASVSPSSMCSQELPVLRFGGSMLHTVVLVGLPFRASLTSRGSNSEYETLCPWKRPQQGYQLEQEAPQVHICRNDRPYWEKSGWRDDGETSRKT